MVDASAPRERAFSFGPFRLLPSRQLLLEGDRPVRLGHRSLELLTALVERSGELVTKAELMARAWPGVVEEGNLRVQMTALRKAPGEDRHGHRYVASVSGRGYRLVAPVERSEPAVHHPAAPRLHNLPLSSMRAIGRADALGVVLQPLPRHRIVSIVGPGDAQALGHVMTLQYVLSEAAIPLALLLDLASRHGFVIWEAWGRCCEAIRLVRSTGTGLPELQAAAGALRQTGFEAHTTFTLGMLAEALRDAGEMCVTVRDPGPGIDPGNADRPFEAFYTTKPGGTGIGLAICRSIVDAHGGRLWVEPDQPWGAVFRFTVPAGPERPYPSIGVPDRPPAEPTRMAAAGAVLYDDPGTRRP